MADDTGAPDRHGSARDDDELTGSTGAAEPDERRDDEGSAAKDGWGGDGAATPLGVGSSNDGPVRGPIG